MKQVVFGNKLYFNGLGESLANRLDRLSTKAHRARSRKSTSFSRLQGVAIVTWIAFFGAVISSPDAAADPPRATAGMVWSRADLLGGVTLDHFYTFDNADSSWGSGVVEHGVLLVDSPFGEATRFAGNRWSPGERFAVEFESRFDRGPVDAEFGVVLDYRPGRQGIRVRISEDGRVVVELYRPGVRGEPIAVADGGGHYRRKGWNRIALRGERRRLSVVIGGEEVLVTTLPFIEEGGFALYASAGSRYRFDHVALYSRTDQRLGGWGGKSGGAGDFAAAGAGAVFFDPFESGGGEWLYDLYPVTNGALRVAPVEGKTSFDLLLLKPFVPRTLETEVSYGNGSSITLLLGARFAGIDFEGWVWDVDPGGNATLSQRRRGEEEIIAGPVPTPLSPGAGKVVLRLVEDDSLRFFAGDASLFSLRPGLIGEGSFGVEARAGNERGFSLDQLVFTTVRGDEPPVGDEAKALWRDAGAMLERDEAATALDRLRRLYLEHPELSRVLDVIYKEAIDAGRVETALAAAGAIRLAGTASGSEAEQLTIMAMLIAGRAGEAYGMLERYRAERPDDPFGLENALLLLDREGEYDRLLAEYEAARASSGPVRATSHGVAAWAYLRTGEPAKATAAVRTGLALGPGRLDLIAVEGEILRARGDAAGAKGKFSALLESPVLPFPEEELRVRIGLLDFDTGAYAEAAGNLAVGAGDEEGAAVRPLQVLRAIALYRTGQDVPGGGKDVLEEALALAEGSIASPPVADDAVLLDLAGRIRTALAVIDLSAGGSYETYRSKRAAAMDYFRRASLLDPSFKALPAAGEEVPALDPSLYTSLVNEAWPVGHPVGGFVENRSRWYSWYVVTKRADLAMRSLSGKLGRWGEDIRRAGRPGGVNR